MLFLTSASYTVAQFTEPETITVDFSTLSWDAAISDLYYRDAGQVTPIIVPNGTLSPPQRYSGPPTLDFFTQAISSEGQPVFHRQASVTFPSGARHWLLIFLKARNTNAYQVQPFPVPDAKFTNGTFNFVNLTDSRLGVRLGEKTFEIDARGSLIATSPGQGSQNVDVQMAASENGDAWQLIYRSRWASLNQRRAWVFIYLDENRKPRIRKYYQKPEAVLETSQYQ